MIKCPECRGVGHHVCGGYIPSQPVTIHKCEWCHGAKVFDETRWVDYQPHRQRPKEQVDIELRDGTIVKGCWPNGDSFFPLHSNEGRIKDYRVVRVRLNNEWLKYCEGENN
jgi:hypothetical protein